MLRKKWILFLLIGSGFQPAAMADLLKRFVISSPRIHPYETVVRFRYSVSCQGEQEDQVTGLLHFQGRRVVLNFYRYRNQFEISLGSAPQDAQTAVLEVLPSAQCQLENLKTEVKYEDVGISSNENSRQLMAKLALIYSPFVNFRENQYKGPPNDVPLLMAYSVHTGSKKRRVLRYTLYLSDEDNQNTSALTNAQLVRYGRTTDIEWIYEIEFDGNLSVVDERFQGALHFPFQFRGGYLPATIGRTHPLLYNYNLGDNNVFMDTAFSWLSIIPNPHQQTEPTGHHLVPRYRMDYPQARERVMFSEPWMFKVSENELKRQGKPAAPVQDQLFVQVRGRLGAGTFRGMLKTSEGNSVLSGGAPCNSSSCNVNELGTSLWSREGFTVVPVGLRQLEEVIPKKVHGEFELVGTSDLNLTIKKFNFFRLRDQGSTYEVEDLSAFFKCRHPELHCRF